MDASARAWAQFEARQRSHGETQFLIAVLAAIDRTVVSTVGPVLAMFNGSWLQTAHYAAWLAGQRLIEPVLALTNAKLPPECQAILILLAAT